MHMIMWVMSNHAIPRSFRFMAVFCPLCSFIGGIHAFTRALAGKLISRGIRVNAVAPGPVWTPLNPADKEAEDIAKFGADTKMKRPAQPEEIAPAYVFLASSHCLVTLLARSCRLLADIEVRMNVHNVAIK